MMKHPDLEIITALLFVFWFRMVASVVLLKYQSTRILSNRRKIKENKLERKRNWKRDKEHKVTQKRKDWNIETCSEREEKKRKRQETNFVCQSFSALNSHMMICLTITMSFLILAWGQGVCVTLSFLDK